MKKLFLYLILLILPLLCMILVNEYVRNTSSDKAFVKNGVTAINPVHKTKSKCTWYCHNDTNYCISHHVKLVQAHFEEIDPFYFGIIRSLKSTGNYALANIIFLVILFPLLIYLLLVKSISLEWEIRELRKNKS